MKNYIKAFLTYFIVLFKSDYFAVALIAIGTIETITAPTISSAIFTATIVVTIGYLLYLKQTTK